MIIHVREGDEATAEWDLIELQGVVRPLDGGTLGGKIIGRMIYNTGGGKATIQVGNMLLEGEVLPIAKPFVLLEKKVDAEAAAKANDEARGVSYIVAGVVKRQFIFRTSRHCPPA